MNNLKYSVFALMLSAPVLTACSDDNFSGDPDKNWNETTEFFQPTYPNGTLTYYNPTIGRCGDPMPFYDQKAKEFKVLYLQEYDQNSACFHPIWGITTTDGGNYQSMGEVLPTGKSTLEQDAAIGTGCCYYNEKDGLYYIYYTGHNGQCENVEVVLRATSADFKTWKKDVTWSLRGAEFGYSTVDFRDPQIFTTEDGLYHMIISTYPATGGDPVFVEFKSSDMKTWEHVGKFPMIWNRMLECPDVFKMGDWWYLVYSDSDRQNWSRKVKYKKAATFEELKTCFGNDAGEVVLDSRAFYAGKTASNGTDRYIWGWCPIRVADKDAKNIHEMNVNVGGGAGNEPKWGGALVCHKVVQHEDGTLTLGEVPAIKAKYTQEQVLTVMKSNGYVNGKLTGDNAYVLYNRLGNCNHISMTVKTEGDGDKFGISLVRGTDSKKYYTMVVNPEEGNAKRKINFEQEGEEGQGFVEGIDGNIFPRPADNTYKIDIYTDNTVMVMYINDNVCYTQRIYGITKNCWSINNYGGSVTISDVKVSQQ